MLERDLLNAIVSLFYFVC